MICGLLTSSPRLADELDSGDQANNSTLTAPTNLTNNQQNSSGFNDSVHRFETLHFNIWVFVPTNVVDPEQVGTESFCWSRLGIRGLPIESGIRLLQFFLHKISKYLQIHT
jgi:hypothetical protein